MRITSILEWALRRKHSLPDTFKFYRWTCMPPTGETIYYEMEGGIPQRVYKRGPRKGRPNYSTCIDVQTLRVTVPESKQFEQDYIATTGNCSSCMGEGKTIARISVVDGTTHRTCSACEGSGKRLVPA